jgi:hypothetical protein
MENKLQERPPEPASNAESACLSTPASLPPCAETPPLANLYDDLQDGEIRLFELDINTTGNIVGRLQTVEMSSAPPFYALSYVCGSDACSEEITIDNHVVLVKPNLFAALQELRSYFQVEHIAQITIWIDAICINQGNEDEKARQIRSMHGVFSGAVEVLAWLGAVDDNIRMVLRVFAWIDSYFELRHDLEALRKHDGEPGYLESIGEASSKAMNSHITLQSCLKVHHRVSYANLRAMAHFLSTLGGMFCDRKFFEKSGITHHEAIRFIMDAPILDAGLFSPDHVFWATIYVLSNLE